MTKHKKYRILGVGFLLLAVLSLSLLAPTYAVETTEASGETVTELTCVELAEKYGLYIEAGENTNEYVVIRDSTLACGDSASKSVPLQVIAINNEAVENGDKLETEDGKITVTAELKTSGNMEYMTVTFKNLNDENETLDVKYEVETHAANNANIGSEPNTQYYARCATFRAEVAALDSTAQAYYVDAISYCWKERVPVGANYTDEELELKIERAKASWTAFNSTTTAVSTTFMEEFNRIKKNAGTVHKYTDTVPNAANAIQLKCKYNALPTAGTTYTNAYGEVINANGDIVNPDGTVLSDGDDTYSYMNKDYYFASKTEESGTVVYTYNYAPGNTKTVTQSNVCKRTCEEAVKVEYGPPVASKAGLCFEYQVKVTSYVTCKSTFSADKPDQPTNYCNPGVRCVSPSGTVRGKPQAGPNSDYETCIYGCDGGQYTQECSVKCYNEVYATSEDNKIKLSVNYEDAQVQKLAKSTSTSRSSSGYSLETCKADNANAYGCYYYDNGTIRWSRNDSITYNQCDITSAGRWYIDTGYGVGDLCTTTSYRNYKYVIDGDGFRRADYGWSLCKDKCSWQSNCGTDTYLNPGTISKDYKSNEAEYENARAACAGAATCSTSTATFTIAVKYDTKDKDGTTTTVNKVYFPYSETKQNPVEDANEYDTIPKATLNSNGTVSKDSIILSKGGCYTDSSVGNKYMTEWSFPGTYIHNKTGEITFKVPSDTSGWYYENSKFCMPLNATSVNTKWWEWYKMGSQCYTDAEIQAELAGTAGTSNGYNIEAITNNFGYFNWNFDIGCFYAIRNEVCEVNNKKCCNTPPPTCPDCPVDKSGVNYVVRTIDREDMFPNAPVAGVVSTDTRETGFNWTDGAKITEFKNSQYKVDPLALIIEIESTADELYNNDTKYLDYQFYLTPTSLRQLRKYNENYNYGEWLGVTKEVNGINTYISNLWNSVGTESGYNLRNITGAVLETGDPGVNNE